MFPQGRHTETLIEKGPTLHFVLAKLGCVSLPGGTSFKGLKGSWRAAEADTMRKPGQVIMKVQTPLKEKLRTKEVMERG